MCSVEHCDKPSYAKGLCQTHYSRQYRLGRCDIPIKKAEWVRSNSTWRGDECLIFPFKRRSSGYGIVSVDSKRVGAHRYMCELVNGPAPSLSHEASHSCGNGSSGCVNPSHLEWATPSENQHHRTKHGTSNHGDRNGSAKLTREQVEEIRESHRLGEPQSSIAERFNISRSNVGLIVTGKTWLAETYGYVSERKAA